MMTDLEMNQIADLEPNDEFAPLICGDFDSENTNQHRILQCPMHVPNVYLSPSII